MQILSKTQKIEFSKNQIIHVTIKMSIHICDAFENYFTILQLQRYITNFIVYQKIVNLSSYVLYK